MGRRKPRRRTRPTGPTADAPAVLYRSHVPGGSTEALIAFQDTFGARIDRLLRTPVPPWYRLRRRRRAERGEPCGSTSSRTCETISRSVGTGRRFLPPLSLSFCTAGSSPPNRHHAVRARLPERTNGNAHPGAVRERNTASSVPSTAIRRRESCSGRPTEATTRVARAVGPCPRATACPRRGRAGHGRPRPRRRRRRLPSGHRSP